MDYKPENPAKTFLKRYRAIKHRQESLIRTLEALREIQTNCTVKLKAVQVSGGGFVRDRMADEVVRVMEIEEQIQESERKAAAALAEIITAIEAVQDETQKTVLTLRYIEGLKWEQIQEKLHYEETQIFVLHGRALWAVNKWMGENNVSINSGSVYGYGKDWIHVLNGQHG